MERLLLMVFVFGVVFFYSCGGEPEPVKQISVADTYWAAELLGDKYELTFTASTASSVFKRSDGYTWIEECAYTYDPPLVKMEVEWKDTPMQIEGNVDNADALTIEILQSHETVMPVKFKKSAPGQGPELKEPTIIGEWKLTHTGTIDDNGKPDMEEYKGMDKYTLKYTFKMDGTGWEYHSNEHQESFKWHSFSNEQLELTDWKDETDYNIDPEYFMDGEWTVWELTYDKLIVSYWMHHINEQPSYHEIMTFKRVIRCD
ncbi:MAG: hypothetical protein LBV47_02585 [Bacteroidales bacterium]|jgi:hypothetical protein|nr:hypothetical protein [Bacteroidales bacterium]